MTTLEQFRNEQQAQYKINHEIQMAKYPWIREAIDSYRDLDFDRMQSRMADAEMGDL